MYIKYKIISLNLDQAKSLYLDLYRYFLKKSLRYFKNLQKKIQIKKLLKNLNYQ